MRTAAAVVLAFAALALVACGKSDGAGAASVVALPPAAAGLGPATATVAAAGDIACAPGDPATADGCQHAATARLVRRLNPGTVLALGDLQYGSSSLAEFQGSYSPTWGTFKARTLPIVGNHEYGTADAAGYFGYWGAQAGARGAGWYARTVGGWRVIALNSNCGQVGGCGPGSPQYAWLARELRTHRARCTLAMWHHPRFSSGEHGSDPITAPLWAALARAGTDVILSGHDHDYERFAPQTSTGQPRAAGPREFVVGTGGRSSYEFLSRARNSVVRRTHTFGVLALTLHQRGYAWSFARAAGAPAADRGQAACR